MPSGQPSEDRFTQPLEYRSVLPKPPCTGRAAVAWFVSGCGLGWAGVAAVEERIAFALMFRYDITVPFGTSPVIACLIMGVSWVLLTVELRAFHRVRPPRVVRRGRAAWFLHGALYFLFGAKLETLYAIVISRTSADHENEPVVWLSWVILLIGPLVSGCLLTARNADSR